MYPQAEPSFATSFDDEYLLTSEEEAAAVDREVKRLQEFYLWRMTDKDGGCGMFSEQAKAKLSEKTREEWEAMINKPELFHRLNSNRLQERWHQQQREREQQEKHAATEKKRVFWNAKQMYRYLAWKSERTGRPLVVNDHTLPLIKALCFFLSGDERFETELGYSLKKGLLIRGTSGLGKSYLVKCLSDNELNPVRIYPVLDVMEGVRQNGEFNIAPGGTIYLDDMGTETAPVKFYGTEINWVKDYIEMYYTSGRPYPGLMLSTNLSFSEVEAKYGYRVRSRLRDMVNVIEVEGEDLRGL